MDLRNVDTLMAAAFGALAAIFIGAFIALILICRRQHKRRVNWERLSKTRKSRYKKQPELSFVLNDIGLGNALEQIINDEQWVDDASGLMPHCLAILRTCHSLTEKLANVTINPISIKGSANRLIITAKRVPSRVDDVGKS